MVAQSLLRIYEKLIVKVKPFNRFLLKTETDYTYYTYIV